MGVEHTKTSASTDAVEFRDEEEYYWSEEEDEKADATSWFLHGFMNRSYDRLDVANPDQNKPPGAVSSLLYALPKKGARLENLSRFSLSFLPLSVWIEVLSFFSKRSRCCFRLVSLAFNELVLGAIPSFALCCVARDRAFEYKDFLTTKISSIRDLSAGSCKLSSLFSVVAYSHRETLETLRCGGLVTPTLLTRIVPRLKNLTCFEVQLESYPIQPTEDLPETIQELRIVDVFDDDGETVSVWVGACPGLKRLGLECGYDSTWESFSHPSVEEIWGRGHACAGGFGDGFLRPFLGETPDEDNDGLIRFPDVMMDDLERFFPSIRHLRGVKGQFVVTSQNAKSVVLNSFQRVAQSMPLLWDLDELVLVNSPLEADVAHRRLQSLVVYDSRIEHLELVLNNMPSLKRLMVVSSFFLQMPKSLNLENVVDLHVEPPYIVWPPKRLCRYLRTHAPRLQSFGLRYQMPHPPSSGGPRTSNAFSNRFHTEPLILCLQFLDALQTLRLVEPVRRHQEIYRIDSKKTFFGCLKLRKIVFISDRGDVLKRVWRFTHSAGMIFWKENFVSFDELDEDGSWDRGKLQLRRARLRSYEDVGDQEYDQSLGGKWVESDDEELDLSVLASRSREGTRENSRVSSREGGKSPGDPRSAVRPRSGDTEMTILSRKIDSDGESVRTTQSRGHSQDRVDAIFFGPQNGGVVGESSGSVKGGLLGDAKRSSSEELANPGERPRGPFDALSGDRSELPDDVEQSRFLPGRRLDIPGSLEKDSPHSREVIHSQVSEQQSSGPGRTSASRGTRNLGDGETVRSLVNSRKTERSDGRNMKIQRPSRKLSESEVARDIVSESVGTRSVSAASGQKRNRGSVAEVRIPATQDASGQKRNGGSVAEVRIPATQDASGQKRNRGSVAEVRIPATQDQSRSRNVSADKHRRSPSQERTATVDGRSHSPGAKVGPGRTRESTVSGVRKRESSSRIAEKDDSGSRGDVSRAPVAKKIPLRLRNDSSCVTDRKASLGAVGSSSPKSSSRPSRSLAVRDPSLTRTRRHARKHRASKDPPKPQHRRDLGLDPTDHDIAFGRKRHSGNGLDFDEIPAGVGARRRHFDVMPVIQDSSRPISRESETLPSPVEEASERESTAESDLTSPIESSFDPMTSDGSSGDHSRPTPRDDGLPKRHDLHRVQRLKGMEEVATAESSSTNALRRSFDPMTHGMLKGVFIFERPFGQTIGMPVDHSSFVAQCNRFTRSVGSEPLGTDLSLPVDVPRGATRSMPTRSPIRTSGGRMKELRRAQKVSGPMLELASQSRHPNPASGVSEVDLKMSGKRDRKVAPTVRSSGSRLSGENGGNCVFPSIRRRPSFGERSPRPTRSRKSALVDARGEGISSRFHVPGFASLDEPALQQFARKVDFSSLERLEAEEAARGEPADSWLKELRRMEILRKAWETQYAQRLVRKKQRELELQRISKQQELVRVRMAQAELEERRLRDEAGRRKRRWLLEQEKILSDRVEAEQRGLARSQNERHRELINHELGRRQKESQEALRILLEDDVRRKAKRELLAEQVQNQEVLEGTIRRMVDEEMKKSQNQEEDRVRRILRKRVQENREKESHVRLLEEERRRRIADAEESEGRRRRRKDVRRRRRVELHHAKRTDILRRRRRGFDWEEEKRLVKFLASRENAKQRQDV